MRFLILGATGMAGHLIALYLRERGHEVIGSYRQESMTTAYLSAHGIELTKLDVIEGGSLAAVILDASADVVVNCVALLNAACDERRDLAVYLNAYLPNRLARLVSETPSRVFHISTDGIFAGNTGPYSEAAIPDGTSQYARTKALGELRDNRNLTLRTSIIGPDPDPEGIGLLNWFMHQTTVVTGWTKAIWTGLTTLELAKAVEACARERATGLINMVPRQRGVSKCWLLNSFNENLRSNSIEVRVVEGLNSDKSLIRTNYECSFEPLSYEEQIRELSIWIRKHPGLYPY